MRVELTRDEGGGRRGYGVISLSMVAAGVVGAVVAVALFVRRGSAALAAIAAPDLKLDGDFDSFWRSAKALLSGTDIYRTGAVNVNLNPPFATVVLAPLGIPSPVSSYRLWVLVTIVLVLGSVLLVAVELRLQAAVVATTTVAVLLSAPMLLTLQFGQIYGLLTAGVTAAWLAQRRGHPVLEGVLLGIVVAIKPSLAPILLLPLVRRCWSTLAAGLVAGAVASAVSAAIVGPGVFVDWLRMAASPPEATFFVNASLPATVQRLTSVNPGQSGTPLVELGGGNHVGLAAGLVLLALTAWRVRQRPRADRPDSAPWALVAASLLASPIGWHTYLVVLTPGIVVLIARGRGPVAVLVLGLAAIPYEWVTLWTSALPLSLYCGVLLAAWAGLLFATEVDEGERDHPDERSTPRAASSMNAAVGRD